LHVVEFTSDLYLGWNIADNPQSTNRGKYGIWIRPAEHAYQPVRSNASPIIHQIRNSMLGNRNTRNRSLIREIAQIALSVVIVLLAGFDILGTPLRTVNILILVFGGISAGIPLGRLIERKRTQKSIRTESQDIIE